MKRATGIDLAALEMLRGVLATYVLAGHARALLWAGHTAWMAQPHAAWAVPFVYASAGLRYGREAVMVFFALSGFFIHLRWADAERTGMPDSTSASRFYARRAHRLVPPYAFALAVTMALDGLGRTWMPALYHAATGDALLDSVFAPSGYSARSVAPALVLLPSSLGRDFGTNGPLWSLAYEAIYYALYPPWLALRRRSAWMAFAGVPLAALGAVILLPGGFLADVLGRYAIWLAGAALAERPGAIRRSMGTVGVALLVAMAGFGLHVTSASLVPLVMAAVLYGGGLVVAFGALPEGWLRGRFGALLQFLGRRSYTIYVVHFPFIALLCAWSIASLGGRPLAPWLAIAGGAGAVAFGCACFEACERHFLHAPLSVHARQ